MALVPRVLEARGLDVTPNMIKRLTAAGDQQAADILERIYQDEIEHVRLGSHWFKHQCEARDLDPFTTFHISIHFWKTKTTFNIRFLGITVFHTATLLKRFS